MGEGRGYDTVGLLQPYKNLLLHTDMYLYPVWSNFGYKGSCFETDTCNSDEYGYILRILKVFIFFVGYLFMLFVPAITHVPIKRKVPWSYRNL